MLASDNFLAKHKSLAYDQLAEALFAYETASLICDETFRDDPAEAKEYLIGLLLHLTKYYTSIISKYAQADLETKLRAYELKKFIFSCMMEDLIVLVAKNVGTAELMDIFRSELDSVKIKELTSLLKLMRHEKSLIDNVTVIFERDFLNEKISSNEQGVGSILSRNLAEFSVKNAASVIRICERPGSFLLFLALIAHILNAWLRLLKK